MIPPFRRRGDLPEGVHRASFAEVVERFGYNERRRWLLGQLHWALTRLQRAGVRRVYLGGSFVTSKDQPQDIDGCWDVEPDVDRSRLHRAFIEGAGLAGEADVPGLHLFPNVPGLGFTVRDDVLGRKDGRERGTVLLELDYLGPRASMWGLPDRPRRA